MNTGSLRFFCQASNKLTQLMNWIADPIALLIRLYLFNIFFRSGLLKIMAWQSTLTLFEYEYKVPFVSPLTAAYLGTAAELILPVFVLLGLGARLPALLFFIFNVTNVLFYPLLLTPEYVCAMKDHLIWGILIGIIVLYGPGKWSLDYLLQRKVCNDYKY